MDMHRRVNGFFCVYSLVVRDEREKNDEVAISTDSFSVFVTFSIVCFVAAATNRLELKSQTSSHSMNEIQLKYQSKKKSHFFVRYDGNYKYCVENEKKN